LEEEQTRLKEKHGRSVI